MCKIIINYAKHSIALTSKQCLHHLVITWIHSRFSPTGPLEVVSWGSCSCTSTLRRHANNKEELRRGPEESARKGKEGEERQTNIKNNYRKAYRQLKKRAPRKPRWKCKLWKFKLFTLPQVSSLELSCSEWSGVEFLEWSSWNHLLAINCRTKCDLVRATHAIIVAVFMQFNAQRNFSIAGDNLQLYGIIYATRGWKWPGRSRCDVTCLLTIWIKRS